MDRGRSLLGSTYQTRERLLQDDINQKQYSKILETLKTQPKTLKKYLFNYQKAPTQKQQHQIYRQFRREQNTFKNYRQRLKNQLDDLKGQGVQHQTQHNYVRRELVDAIKQQMTIQLQMNQLILKQKQKKQKIYQTLQIKQGKSTRIDNALQDIIQKTEQIKQLDRDVQQCLQLLKIIGILVEDNGIKIDQVAQNVTKAYEEIGQAGKKIDQAKIRQQRSLRKKCCIIFFGILAIVLILIVLYGINVINV